MSRWVQAMPVVAMFFLDVLAEAATGAIGTYRASERGLSTRSYWIEGDIGLVLIGTQLLSSEAERFVREAEGRTGKKAVMALMLSPTPEQFNGTATLQKRGIKVYTSEQVAQRIPGAFSKAQKMVTAEMKPDYPAAPPRPVSFGDATQRMMIAGLPLKLHVLGPGVADAHVAVEYEGELFCGELVAGPVHPMPGTASVEDWLKRLQELRAIKPKRVYSAHGEPGGPALIANQMIYLRQLIGFVTAEQPRLPADPQALERVKGKMLEAYPSHGSAQNLDALIRSEWERQAAKAN